MIWLLERLPIFLCLGFIIYWATHIDFRDPINGLLTTEAINSPVRPGQQLVVAISRDKVRSDCPVTSERFLVNSDGRKAPLPTSSSAGGPPKDGVIYWGYDIPQGTPPGMYLLRVNLTYDCPLWMTFFHRQEDTSFRVVAP